jgi:heat shock protein HslJ
MNTNTAATAEQARLLQAYRWRLVSATGPNGRPVPALATRPDRPVHLVFAPASGRIGVSGGCNRMGGSYTLDATGALGVSQWMGTRMACEPALMRLDTALGAFLAAPMRLSTNGNTPSAGANAPSPAASPAGNPSGTNPTLTLTAANQARLVFTGEATAETRYGGVPETIFLEVAPKRVPCAQPLIRNATCLQVRERRFDAAGLAVGAPGTWQPLYGEIEGYTPAEGMRQVLRVKRFQRPAPVPADQSATALVLDMVVESELVSR